MRTTTTLAAALLVAVVAGGAATADAAPPLRERVVQHDMPGFWPDQPDEVAHSARAWYALCFGRSCRAARRALAARGFVVGIRQHLNGPSAEATSAALEFASPAGARSEVAAAIAAVRPGSSVTTPVAVRGIPGARGVARATVEFKGYLIAFAVGRICYVLDVLYPRETRSPIPLARVLAGARALHRRVHRR